MTSLLDILMPKATPEPVNARLVSPQDHRQEPLTLSDSKARSREARRQWLADNRERQNEKRRKR